MITIAISGFDPTNEVINTLKGMELTKNTLIEAVAPGLGIWFYLFDGEQYRRPDEKEFKKYLTNENYHV